MIQNNSHNNHDCHAQEFVISACSFTFQGYRLLLKEQGGVASQVRFEDDVANREDVYTIIKNQDAKITVFLGEEIVDLLQSLRHLADLLNTLPVIRPVTLYGNIPDSWLYGTLRSLLNNNQKLSLIRIANSGDIIARVQKKTTHAGTDLVHCRIIMRTVALKTVKKGSQTENLMSY